MSLELTDIEIHENEEKGRFEARVGDHLAVMDRYYNEDSLVITHTGVPDELSGQGLASYMARTVLDGARQRGLSVVPVCPFVAAYIKRHPEYQDLLRKGRGQQAGS
jgi:predicted GNAT family acetyltransferase